MLGLVNQTNPLSIVPKNKASSEFWLIRPKSAERSVTSTSGDLVLERDIHQRRSFATPEWVGCSVIRVYEHSKCSQVYRPGGKESPQAWNIGGTKVPSPERSGPLES